MTLEPDDLTVRPVTGRGELGRFCQLPYALNHELADDLDQGRRRPEWMWMALRGDHCARQRPASGRPALTP